MTLQEALALAERIKYRPLPREASNLVREHYEKEVTRAGWLLEGAEVPVHTLAHNIHIATGYTRVVIGDYGAFVEFTAAQLHQEQFGYKWGNQRAPEGRYYTWMVVHQDSTVKLYWQHRTVRYADYRVNRCYIAPGELMPQEGE